MQLPPAHATVLGTALPWKHYTKQASYYGKIPFQNAVEISSFNTGCCNNVIGTYSYIEFLLNAGSCLVIEVHYITIVALFPVHLQWHKSWNVAISIQRIGQNQTSELVNKSLLVVDPSLLAGSLVLRPSLVPYERGSGDIQLIPRASLTLITFWREISLRQSHCRKNNL